MKHILAAIVGLCLVATAATAFYQSRDSNYNQNIVSSGGGYTGPGDIVTFSGWWGLRAYSSATRGTKAISLCDHLGANCADVATSATTGVLNAPGTRGSDNCTSLTTCTVATIYDKVSTNDCTQATVANQATLNMTGGPGGNTPALVFNGSSAQYSCIQSNQAQPVSLSTVAERTSAFTSFGTAVSYGGTNDLGFNSSANSAYIYAGAIGSATATDSAWHAMQGLLSGASSALYIDGTNTGSLSAGTSATGGGNTTIGNGVGGFLTGRASEFGTVASDASANFSIINSNQHTFWGF